MQLFRDSEYKSIHFIGICGTAMAAVAAELHRAGYRVTGSDSGAYPPMSDFLDDQGVGMIEGYHPDNLPVDALIVVGNAVSRGNIELEAALNGGYCLISLPELISRRYLTGKTSIVVTGTHGKTTTASMTAHILRTAGRDPGWMVGGMPLDLETPCRMGSGEEFVIEGDEYDSVYFDKRPKFFHYQPRIAVLTSVEFDHSDIYDDIHAVEAVFRRFVRLLPQSGRLIVCSDDFRAMEVASDAFCGIETYGSAFGSDWQVRDITEPGYSDLRGEFTGPSGRSGVIELPMIGKYNLKNAMAALAVATSVGVDINDALTALKDFRGIRRRMEMLIETDDVVVWEDFAHHPTAVMNTLSGLRRRYPGKRLWALFEPRTNTMARNYLADELTESLAYADRVVIGPVHRCEKIPQKERLDTVAIARALSERGITAFAADSFDDVESEVERNTAKGDVIVIMSNGDFGGVKERIAKSLKVGKLQCGTG